MNRDVLFSSKKKDWATPILFFEKLDHEFGFDLDVCADKDNAKCNLYISEKEDALKQDWHDYSEVETEKAICWMNPPYGRQIGKWMKKAYEESLKKCIVVCLVPARTDTAWWFRYCIISSEIRFIKGRLTFGSEKYWSWVWKHEYINGKKNSLYKKYGKKNCAGFPSAVVIFDEEKRRENILNGTNPIITWWKYD